MPEKTTKRKTTQKKKAVVEQTHQQENTASTPPVRQLYRSETNKVFGGVAGGLGEYFGIDPVLIRLLFIIFTLLHGSGLILYFILWLILPTYSSINTSQDTNEIFQNNLQEVKGEVRNFSQRVGVSNQSKAGSWAGTLLIIFGIIILLDNYGFHFWLTFEKIWPLLLIIAGLILVFRK